MGDFNKFNKLGNSRRGGFDSRKFVKRDLGTKQKFDAVCADCRKDCQVPFRPTGKHDVFCDNCFRNKKGDENPDYNSKKSFSRERNSFEKRNSFERNLDLVSSTPVYDGITKQQFELIDKKLDRILNILNTNQRSETHDMNKPLIEIARKVDKNIKKVEKKIIKKEKNKVSLKKKKVTTKKIKAGRKK